MDTQYWIGTFCFEMIAKKVKRVIEASYSGLGQPWDPVWVQYYDAVEITSPIALYKGRINSREPTKEALGLSRNSGITLIYIASFSMWEYDQKTRAKSRNVNV